MCYHTRLSKQKEEIEKWAETGFVPELSFEPQGQINGFNLPSTPVILQGNSLISLAGWGLRTPWQVEEKERMQLLNLRLSSLEDKPSFQIYKQNRCLVIVDGFYEWKHEGRNRIKYMMHFDHHLFCLAGVYAKLGNETTYSILTTEAKGIMEKIHHSRLRMPIALKTKEEQMTWLEKAEIYSSWDFETWPTYKSQQSSLF